MRQTAFYLKFVSLKYWTILALFRVWKFYNCLRRWALIVHTCLDLRMSFMMYEIQAVWALKMDATAVYLDFFVYEGSTCQIIYKPSQYLGIYVPMFFEYFNTNYSIRVLLWTSLKWMVKIRTIDIVDMEDQDTNNRHAVLLYVCIPWLYLSLYGGSTLCSWNLLIIKYWNWNIIYPKKK